MFMDMADQCSGPVQLGDRQQHHLSKRRVLHHLTALLTAATQEWLIHQGIRQGYLADIVQLGRIADRLELLFPHVGHPGQLLCHIHHPLAVSHPIGKAHVQHVGQDL